MPVEVLMYRPQWMEEGSTWYYTHQLKDELGLPLGSSIIDTLTLTLYDMESSTQPIILDWDAKNVKAANGGTVSGTGKFEWRLPASDAILLQPTRSYERRGILLTWTTLTGKTFHHQVHTAIANLSKVGLE